MNELTFKAYQDVARTTAIYPTPITYPALGLTNEAGEVAGKLKKIIRDKDGVPSAEDKVAMLAECGDVLWYISNLLQDLGEGFPQAIQAVNPDRLGASTETFADYVEHAHLSAAGRRTNETSLLIAVVNLTYYAASAAVQAVDLTTIEGDELDLSYARLDFLYFIGTALDLLRQVVAFLDGTLADVAQANLDKLLSRKARNVLGGSGDNR